MLERIDDGGIFQRFYEALKSDKRFVSHGFANHVTAFFKIAYKYKNHSVYMDQIALKCRDGVLHIGWDKGMKSYEITFDPNDYATQNIEKLVDALLDSIPPIAEQKNNIDILTNENSSSEEKLKALKSTSITRAFLDKFDEFTKRPTDFIFFIDDVAALANLSSEELYAALFL